jgi:hypothetical protein
MSVPSKRIILYDLEEPMLLISAKSGVLYQNQAGGNLCYQMEFEGVLMPLGISTANSRSIGKLNFSSEKKGISRDVADAIDDILSSETETKFLRVDRERMHESMEAWIYVRVTSSQGDFPTIESALLTRNTPLSYSFGFGLCSGVLTWPNSD